MRIKNAVLLICCYVSLTSGAKIIPLAHYDQPTDSDVIDDNSSSIDRSDHNAMIASDEDAYAEYRSVMVVTPSSTSVEEEDDDYRESRQMRQAVTTARPRKKDKDGLMAKILPMLVMPFLISSSLIPMMLTSLKFMLIKSLFVGKVAIFLLALNALWKSENRGAVYSHNVNFEHEHQQKDLHMGHYGYNGDEEYGAYVNRRMGEFR